MTMQGHLNTKIRKGTIARVFKSLSRTVTCIVELPALICVIPRGRDLTPPCLDYHTWYCIPWVNCPSYPQVPYVLDAHDKWYINCDYLWISSPYITPTWSTPIPERLKALAQLNTLSKGILALELGLQNDEGIRKQRRVPSHEQSRGLECKSRCKNSWARFSPRAPYVKRAAWMLLREKGNTPRMFVSIALERRVPHLNFSHGLHQQGCWNFFLWGQDYLLLHEITTGASRTSDEPPIDQEHRTGVRADQAHRARLIARSITSLGCLSLVKSLFGLFCFFE